MKSDSPDIASKTYNAMSPDWRLCRDVYAGTRVIREAQDMYLAKNPGETSEAYANRLRRTEFFNAFRLTAEAAAGMVFRKPIMPSQDMPDQVQSHIMNIDLSGRTLDDFAIGVFRDAMITGHTHILVDFPRLKNVSNLEQERQAGARPYWVHITAENLLSWLAEQRGGAYVLTQAVIREVVAVPDGAFGERETTRYRVLNPGSWRLFEKLDDGKSKPEFMEIDSGVTSIDFIPLATINLNPEGFLLSRPPLVELANQCISHYNVLADHRHSLHMSSVAVLVIEQGDGATEKLASEIVISSDRALLLPHGGKAYYAEHEGKALGATRQELIDIEARMAKAGLSLLAPRDNPELKATQVRIEKSESDSALALMTKEVERGMNEALSFHARWMRIETAGTVKINRDFDALAMSPNEITAISDMVSKGQLSVEMLWDALKRGEVLPETFDAEIEAERIGAVFGGGQAGNEK